MSKHITRLPTGMHRPIESVKKSLRNSVDLVIRSDDEDAIRVMDQCFEYMFKNVYMFRKLVGPKNPYQEKAEVVSFRPKDPREK